MVVACLCCMSISAQSDPISSSRFIISCGCGVMEMCWGSQVQVAVVDSEACNFVEDHHSTVQCSSGEGLSAVRATLTLRRSLRLEGGIQSI